jgi:hypothetical protein
MTALSIQVAMAVMPEKKCSTAAVEEWMNQQAVIQPSLQPDAGSLQVHMTRLSMMPAMAITPMRNINSFR